MKRVLSSRNWNGSWKNKVCTGRGSVVRLVQIYSERAASTMKCGAFVAYSVHATLLNFSALYILSFIYNGRTLVGLLPVEYEEH